MTETTSATGPIVRQGEASLELSNNSITAKYTLTIDAGAKSPLVNMTDTELELWLDQLTFVMYTIVGCATNALSKCDEADISDSESLADSRTVSWLGASVTVELLFDGTFSVPAGSRQDVFDEMLALTESLTERHLNPEIAVAEARSRAESLASLMGFREDGFDGASPEEGPRLMIISVGAVGPYGDY